MGAGAWPAARQPVAKAALAVPRLHPIFDIDGMPHVMVTHLAAGVPLSRLGTIVRSLRSDSCTITNALDVLIIAI